MRVTSTPYSSEDKIMNEIEEHQNNSSPVLRQLRLQLSHLTIYAEY